MSFSHLAGHYGAKQQTVTRGYRERWTVTLLYNICKYREKKIEAKGTPIILCICIVMSIRSNVFA